MAAEIISEDFENKAKSLVLQLDQFLYVASKAVSDVSFSSSLTEEDMNTASVALSLLQNLPATRPAALAYLGHLLGKQVSSYMRSGGTESSSGSSNNGSSGSSDATQLLSDVEEVLYGLLDAEQKSEQDSTPGLWCELVCSWGVEMLSVWATEYGRLGGILEEVVSMWLNCPVVRVVVGLVAVCVARDPQNTVAHILNTASGTPSLVWLVAHIGASYPGPVLAFLLDPSLQVSLEPEQLERTTAILSHLALQHSSAVGQALKALLERVVQGYCLPGAGPQLLLLLTRSPPLLGTLTAALPSLLTPNSLNRLAAQVSTWVPTYFNSWLDVQQICVQLLLDCAGPSLLQMLMHGISPSNYSEGRHSLLPIVKKCLGILLRALLNELCTLTYGRRHSKLRVSLLVSLGQPATTGGIAEQPLAPVLRWAMQLSTATPVVRAVTQVIVMSCSQQLSPAEGGLWPYLVETYPPSPDSLHVISRLTLAIVREAQPGTIAMEKPLADVFSLSGNKLITALHNVNYLLSAHILYAPLCEAVSVLLPNLARLINLPKTGLSVLRLLDKVTLSQPVSLANTSSLANSICCFLLGVLDSEDADAKLTAVEYCNRLLGQLSSSSCGHGLIIRLIVESLFRAEWAHVFGSRASPAPDFASNSGSDEDSKTLLKANYSFDSWVKMPHSHTTIFHSGVIGAGIGSVTLPGYERTLKPATVSLNRQLILNTLCSISRQHDHAPLTIALLLVEIISPDIMYNGFPWPDENVKFTIERDLAIKKTFEDFPIAWDLLEYVASNRPALCYCSVLVRALTSSFISTWSTSALSKSSHAPKQLRATERLLEVMVVGQFLPQNMHVLPQMIAHLVPSEVVVVLQDVWDYMRDNTPSPDRWTLLPNRQHDRSNHHTDPRSFDSCRRLIHFHVQTLGHLLPAILQSPLSSLPHMS